MTELELDGITKVFGAGRRAATAVHEATFRIEAGELFFLLGPSGCGKTTLLRMVAGLTSPTSGRILFAGKDVTRQAVEERNTAMVFQSYALWPHMTVQQNVEFGPRMQKAPAEQRRGRAAESLARVEMDGYELRKPNQLSGGQQQRVALARALAAEPACLLLDEPLSNLDARLRMHMRSELRTLVKSTGTTGIYVTHDQKEALSMADRIAVMNAGQVVQIGTPSELYERPATHFVADFLGEANFLPGEVAQVDPLQVTTAAGTLVSAVPSDVTAGEEVTCCVRPERVDIQPCEADEALPPGSVRAAVVGSTFLGEVRQYVCRLADGTEWKVTRLGERAEPLAEGTSVRLDAGPDDVTVLPGPAPEGA